MAKYKVEFWDGVNWIKSVASPYKAGSLLEAAYMHGNRVNANEYDHNRLRVTLLPEVPQSKVFVYVPERTIEAHFEEEK